MCSCMYLTRIYTYLIRDGCSRSSSRATTDGRCPWISTAWCQTTVSSRSSAHAWLPYCQTNSDMVDQGSIVLKKAKSFSFCKQGVIVEGESTPIKSNVVIFVTGYKGMFTSSLFRDIVTGPPSSIIPLYRFNLSFS